MFLVEHRRDYVAELRPDEVDRELRADVLRMTLSGTGFTPGLLTPAVATIRRRAGDPDLRELDLAELRGAWDDDHVPSALLSPRRAITVDARRPGRPSATEVLLEDERGRLVVTWSAPGKLELRGVRAWSTGETTAPATVSVEGADPRRALRLADWWVVAGSGPATDNLDTVVDALLARDAVWWRRTTRERDLSHESVERTERWLQVGGSWYHPDSEGHLTAVPAPSGWPRGADSRSSSRTLTPSRSRNRRLRHGRRQDVPCRSGRQSVDGVVAGGPQVLHGIGAPGPPGG